MSKNSSIRLVYFGNGFGTENNWNNATETSIEAGYNCVYTRAFVSMEMSENIIFKAKIASVELTKWILKCVLKCNAWNVFQIGKLWPIMEQNLCSKKLTEPMLKSE